MSQTTQYIIMRRSCVAVAQRTSSLCGSSRRLFSYTALALSNDGNPVGTAAAVAAVESQAPPPSSKGQASSGSPAQQEGTSPSRKQMLGNPSPWVGNKTEAGVAGAPPRTMTNRFLTIAAKVTAVYLFLLVSYTVLMGVANTKSKKPAEGSN